MTSDRQGARRATFFEPTMLAAIDLDQFAVVLTPQSRLMEGAPLFARQPELGLHHPLAQRLAGDLKPISLQ